MPTKQQYEYLFSLMENIGAFTYIDVDPTGIIYNKAPSFLTTIPIKIDSTSKITDFLSTRGSNKLSEMLNQASQGKESVCRNIHFHIPNHDTPIICNIVTRAHTPPLTRIFIVPVSNSQKFSNNMLQYHKLVSLGSLSAGIAHDLNNLFTSAYIYLALLELDIENPRLKHHVKVIHADLDQATQLSTKIMSFIRSDNNPEKPIDPIACINDISFILTKTLGSRISFSIKLPKKTYPVDITYGDLSQIIMNLTINARDALQNASGRVTLECYYEEHESNDFYFVIRVEDNGKGIPKKNLQSIFTPFFTTKDANRGTGLGLNIVLEIVQRAHGFVEIHTIEGLKTNFKIFIPAKTIS